MPPPAHPPSTASSSSSTSAPTTTVRELNDAQKGDLARIWSSHASELFEPSGGGSSSSFSRPNDASSPSRGGGEGGGPPPLDDHAYGFVVRLHSFFLHVARTGRAGNGAGSGGTAPPSAMTQASGVTTTTGGGGVGSSRTYDSLRFLFPASEGTSSTTASIHTRPILPPEGRTVVTFDHGSFNSELDSFETGCGGGDDDDDENGGGRPPIPEGYVRERSFGAYLHHRPESALAAAGSALALAVATLWRRSVDDPTRGQNRQHQRTPAPQQPQGPIQRFLDFAKFVMRYANVAPRVRMVDVKTGMAYKFVSIKGHVTKARPKRLRVRTADFQCAKCGEQFPHRFADGRYDVPPKCRGLKCRSRNFVLLRRTAEYVDVQEVKLQESQDETTTDAGRTPRQMEVELTHDLVDCANAGDVVRVSGTIHAVNSAVAAGKTGKRALETSTYKLYVKANYVANMTAESGGEGRGGGNGGNGGRTGRGGAGPAAVSFDDDQLRSIADLAHADHRYFGMAERRAFPFDLLVRSLCPSIIGHDTVKAGILLGLLGGTPPQSSGLEARASSANSIRSNSHVLIVGDPGMGKSQMLLAASQIAARSVYVGGNTASTTGLTVSLTKEAGGEVGIEAGALVLADQGVCCIDEFDKMTKTNQDGLLEAMEQQQISIAKAGVVASLPARCSVVAAANPRHGSYNMGKTVAENLNMATPLLSRFDLVFILRDKADKDRDRLVSSNIMKVYRQRGDGATTAGGDDGDERDADLDVPAEGPNNGGDGRRVPMKRRLPWVSQFQREPLPADLVKDYVSYAKEYCKPKLTHEAAEVLKRYFMELRYPTNGPSRNDSVPITTRQLEALIRLSQARAKACLREYVLAEDAEDVVELMTQSVDQVHMDESGHIDRTRGGAGGKSKRKVKKDFLAELERSGMTSFTMDELRRVSVRVDCGLNDFRPVLEELRNDGAIMKTPSGDYRLA